MRKIIFSLLVSVLLVGFMSCDLMLTPEPSLSDEEVFETFVIATIGMQNSMIVWYDNWYATNQEVTINLYEANGVDFERTVDHVNGINPSLVDVFILTSLVLDGEGNPWALQHEGTVTFVTSTFVNVSVQLDVLWIGDNDTETNVLTINGIDYTPEYHAFMIEQLSN